MTAERESPKVDLDAIFGPRRDRRAASQRRACLLAGRDTPDPEDALAVQQEAAAFALVVSGYAAGAVARLGHEFLIWAGRSLHSPEIAEVRGTPARAIAQEILDQLVQAQVPLPAPRELYLALADAVRGTILEYAVRGPRQEGGAPPAETPTAHARADETAKPGEQSPPGQGHWFVQTADRLLALIRANPAGYADAYLLHHFAGRTPFEIAQRLLGQEESAVKGRIKFILVRLTLDAAETTASR